MDVDSGETAMQNFSSWSPPKTFEASVTRSQLSAHDAHTAIAPALGRQKQVDL